MIDNSYEEEIRRKNTAFIQALGRTAESNLTDLLAGADVTGEIKFVDKPCGDRQHENVGPYKDIYVNQSCGYSGDDYTGEIYAKVKKRWIEIPYAC